MCNSCKFTCQICGLPVEDSDLRKYQNLVGHDTCIKKHIDKLGLNESEANVKKTTFLLD